jgi:hypothetical protein
MAGRHGQAIASRQQHRETAPCTGAGPSVERATQRATKPRRGPVANRATYMGCTVVHATRGDPVARGCTPVTHRLHAGSRQEARFRGSLSVLPSPSRPDGSLLGCQTDRASVKETKKLSRARVHAHLAPYLYLHVSISDCRDACEPQKNLRGESQSYVSALACALPPFAGHRCGGIGCPPTENACQFSVFCLLTGFAAAPRSKLCA